MANRLNIGKVISGAFLIPWANRHAFGRALAIPISALLILAWIEQHITPLFFGSTILLVVVEIAVITVFAIKCHRMVLLEESSSTLQVIPIWSKRETRFFLWIWTIVLIFLIAALGIITFLINLFGAFMDPKDLTPLSPGVFMVLGFLTYLFARISIIFPAVAIDQNVNLKSAWRLTKANGWRLVFVVGITPWVISKTLDLVSRNNGTILETLILTFVACVFAVFQVTALSLSYGELLKIEGSQNNIEQA